MYVHSGKDKIVETQERKMEERQMDKQTERRKQ